MLRFTLLLGLVVGCTPPPPHATTSDAIRANLALAQLETGRSLLVHRCSGCHTTPLPSAHTAAEWPARLDEMAARSNLDRRQRQAIEQYLTTMARR